MLRELEDFLVPAIATAMPPPVAIQRGPFVVANPWPADQRTLVVHARRLRPTPPAPTAEDDGPAFLWREQTWPTDGVTDAFELPDKTEGQIYEVEAPPGLPAVRGDDFLVESRTIRFYRAPATGTPGVLARLRTADAHGYARRQLCIIELDVSAYADGLDHADPMLATAAQVVLAALTRTPRLVLPSVTGVDVLVRLLEPRTTLTEIERTIVEPAGAFRASVRLELTGRLDLLVAQGDPAPTSVIEQLEGQLEVDPATGEPPTPVPIHVSASKK